MGMSWCTFEGFTFLPGVERGFQTEEIMDALLATEHVAHSYNAKTLALVNLSILFKALVHFQPYLSLPEFWQVICEKWCPESSVDVVRHIVHYYVGARAHFIDSNGTTSPQPVTELSELSEVLTELVDEWRQMYGSYFEMRNKAHRSPEYQLRDELTEAEYTWDHVFTIFLPEVEAMLPEVMEVDSSEEDDRKMPATTRARVQRPLAHKNFTSPSSTPGLPEMEHDAIRPELSADMDLDDLTPNKYAMSSLSRSTGSSYNPRRLDSDGSYQEHDYDEYTDMAANDTDHTFELPLRLTTGRPLFPSIQGTSAGISQAPQAPQASGQDVAVGGRGSEDTEDWNTMNGKLLVGPLTLSGMIKAYMKQREDAGVVGHQAE